MGRRDAGRIRLGGTRWCVHPEFVLRSAGFPVEDVLRLGDGGLAAAADACPADRGPEPDSGFAGEYAAAADRAAEEIRRLAADPGYRAALIWQNPALAEVAGWLAAGARMTGKRRRQRETGFVSYLQRYTTKNDSIGFFGPIAWGWVVPGTAGVTVRPGPGLVRRREVSFEWWAVDAVARAWSADPRVLPWLRPRLAEPWTVAGGRLRGPRGRVPEWVQGDLELLRRCDGSQTVAGLAAALAAPDVPERLRELARRDVVILDLAGPFEARPEATLRDKVREIGDPELRDRWLADLDELVGAKDRVAATAGDPAGLAPATAELGRVFERIAGVAPTRRPGESYAGRTVVYEDTVRDLDVALGTGVLDAVAEPLALVMESGAWLLARAGAAYTARFEELYERCRERYGAPDVPLDLLVGAATRDLRFERRARPPIVAALSAELAAAWQRILDVPDGVRQYSVPPEKIADRVRGEFAAAGPPPWSAARYQAPDLLVAAADTLALDRGDFEVVLGELHLGMNTMENSPLVRLHPDPARLLAYARADHGGRRVVAVPSRFSSQVTSRTYPPALSSDDVCHWSMYPHHTGAPGHVVPAGELVVRRSRDAGLVVVDTVRGRGFGLLEVLGDHLSAVLLNAFSVGAVGRHRPRISIGRLVVAREAWSFGAGELTAWAATKDEALRYLRMRRWARAHGLPRQVFVLAPGEIKPVYLDFASAPLARMAATMIRRAADQDPDGVVGFSEMLPTPQQCWLADAAGRRYTSELRLLCLDPSWSGPPTDG